MLFLVNLQLHKKDDGPSQTEALGKSRELQQSIQERDLRIVTRGSKRKAEEAQLIATMNPKKKKYDDAAVQANYLTVAECKKLLSLLANLYLYMNHG